MSYQRIPRRSSPPNRVSNGPGAVVMRALCRRVTVLVGAVISLAAPAWAAMSADQVATAFSGGKAHGQLIPVLRNENPAIQCGICAPPFSAKDSG